MMICILVCLLQQNVILLQQSIKVQKDYILILVIIKLIANGDSKLVYIVCVYSLLAVKYVINFVCIFTVKAEVVDAGCRLPQNFSGDWVNTANMDADVFINETHVIETWYPDEARFRRTIYVCREQRGSRYMMARLTVDGW